MSLRSQLDPRVALAHVRYRLTALVQEMKPDASDMLRLMRCCGSTLVFTLDVVWMWRSWRAGPLALIAIHKANYPDS